MSVPRRIIIGCITVIALLCTAIPSSQAALPRVVIDALAVAAQNPANLSDGQRAILVMYNRDINRAGMLPPDLGGIDNPFYQGAQQVFQDVSRPTAANAGRNVNADFRVQPSKKTEYVPGTDSDYIYQLDPNSANPVDDVRRMQTDYNRGINDFIERSLERDPAIRTALEAEGVRFEPRSDWHRQLDVDFMADPRTVTQSQFEEIARLNNDAYKRREAAEFERISRAGDGTPVTPEIYTAYVEEMQDFIKHKRDLIAEFQAEPELLSDPNRLADFHRVMAQEEKYIERVESTNAHLRTQERLVGRLADPHAATYVVTYDEQGNAIIKQRSEGTLARRGAGRRASDFRTSAAAASVSINSETRALTELSESMAQAARANPGKWPNFSRDIAKLVDHLSPAAKGELIERIARQAGPDIARQVAEAMRNQTSAAASAGQASRTLVTKLDDALRRGLGISDDLSRMSNLRRGFNETAGAILGDLDKISRAADTLEAIQAAASLREWAVNIRKAMDPNISDEEADIYFGNAWAAAQSLTIQGGLGALFESFPTAGAAYLSWTIGFDGTSYILINTETGQEFNRRATDYIDRHQQATGQAIKDLAAWLGVDPEEILGIVGLEDDEARHAAEQANLEASLRDAIAEGRVVLLPGVTVKELIDLLRAGDGIGIRERIEPVTTDNIDLVIRTLQDELLAIHRMAGELDADIQLLQQELRIARQQQVIANRQLAIAEDLNRKLQLQSIQCADVAEAPLSIQEISQQAVELEESIRQGVDRLIATVRDSQSAGEQQTAREQLANWRDVAKQVRTLATQARNQNEQLLETLLSARAHQETFARALNALDQGDAAVQQGTVSCLRIQEVASRHDDRQSRFLQRKAQLQGQIERMQETHQQQPEALIRLQSLNDSLLALTGAQDSADLVADSETSRESLEVLLEALRALRNGLFDPADCARLLPQPDAVSAALQAAESAETLIAQAEQLLGIPRSSTTDQAADAQGQGTPSTPDMVRPEDLTTGVTDRRPTQPRLDPADLLSGVGDSRRPADDRTRNPTDPSSIPDRPDTQPRNTTPTPDEETPLFAIYAVHAYPSPPQDLSRIREWQQQVLNPRTFAPQERTLGYIAFKVTGELRQDYEAHRKRQSEGQTSEDYQWFIPQARYHQVLDFRSETGAHQVPLLLSFVRMEEEEPAWVTRTTIGFQANAGIPGRIETLSDPATRGSWQARIQGQPCSVGPLQFDGKQDWSLETRTQAVSFMRELFSALEDLFRSP